MQAHYVPYVLAWRIETGVYVHSQAVEPTVLYTAWCSVRSSAVEPNWAES